MYKKIRTAFIIVITVVMILLPTSAFAASTYFTEDFETTNVTEYPDSFTFLGSSLPFTAEVVNQSGSNWLRFSSTNPGNSSNAAVFTPLSQETEITLEFDFFTDLSESYVGFQFGVPDSFVSAMVRSDGSVGDSSNEYAPAGTVKPDTIHNVRVVIDLVNDVADVFVDDVQYVTDLPTASGMPASAVRFYSHDSDGYNELSPLAYVDNVVITGAYTEPAPTPTPAPTPVPNPETGEQSWFDIIVEWFNRVFQ